MEVTVATKLEQEPAGSAGRRQDKTLGEFLAMLNWAASQPGVPTAVVNALRAASWAAEVAVFRTHEEQLLSDGRHRLFLSELIFKGELAIHEIRKSGFSEAETVLTIEDLKSTLESLHTTFRCTYGPKNSTQTDEQIMKLFADV